MVALRKRGREENTQGQGRPLGPAPVRVLGRDHPTSNLAPANWPLQYHWAEKALSHSCSHWPGILSWEPRILTVRIPYAEEDQGRGQPSGPGRETWKWFSQNLQFEPTLQTLRSGTLAQNYTRIHFCCAKSLSLWWGFCLFVLFFYSSLRRPAQVPCKGWLQQSFSIGLGSTVKGESFPWKVGCSVSWAWYRSDQLQAATTQSGQLSQKDAGNLKGGFSIHRSSIVIPRGNQAYGGPRWTSLSMHISNYRAKEMRNLWQSFEIQETGEWSKSVWVALVP